MKTYKLSYHGVASTAIRDFGVVVRTSLNGCHISFYSSKTTRIASMSKQGRRWNGYCSDFEIPEEKNVRLLTKANCAKWCIDNLIGIAAD